MRQRVTKGVGRISEVSARFALDAMPGKQMAIDAELARGEVVVVEDCFVIHIKEIVDAKKRAA